jgi:hypothetical protein
VEPAANAIAELADYKLSPQLISVGVLLAVALWWRGPGEASPPLPPPKPIVAAVAPVPPPQPTLPPIAMVDADGKSAIDHLLAEVQPKAQPPRTAPIRPPKVVIINRPQPAAGPTIRSVASESPQPTPTSKGPRP